VFCGRPGCGRRPDRCSGRGYRSLSAQVLVAQEVLDGPDVVPVLEQMGCKGVPEGVAGSRLGQARPAGSFLNSYMRAG